jgi:hypothetical protein
MMLFAIYLLLVIALPITLSGLIGFRSLPHGTACPNCAQDTLPLLSLPLRIAQRFYSGFSLQRRWCPICEWDGYARVNARPAFALALTDGSAQNAQPVRTLELGGRAWTVMVESWRERGRYYGRLTFVAPSGKRWSDPLPAFNGTSQTDVLGQALALSDRLLAYRLREVISG